MDSALRVLIIGAGSSGLTAIKCCLDEGLMPVCYERTDRVGGLWHYTDGIYDGQACVMRSTTINSSKEMMSYSDFPVPDDFPNYMHNRKVLEYFRLYMKHFDLEKYVHNNKEILGVSRDETSSKAGRWKVKIKDLKDGEVNEDIFDGVLICTGHHAEKRMPNFAGENTFKGKILHSHDYKEPHGYENKRVVIVGMGNSSGDVAVELAKVTSQVYMSTRRGSWVVNRIGDNGLPTDLLVGTRFKLALGKLMGPSKLNAMVEAQLNGKFDHKLYGIMPDHHFTEQHPMTNDDLPNRIATGSIIIKPDVRRILPNGVEFADGSIVENIDVIIYATGYIFGFPFLDKKVIEVKDNELELFKYMFPPTEAPPTLAVIGCVQPIGSTISIAEMQCRWATRAIKGLCSLPSKNEMFQDIANKKAAMRARYIKTPRHTLQVDWIPYMDEIAEQIGCRPNLSRLFLSDPVLAVHMYFGPCTPIHYRLIGPGKWDKAREKILTLWDRVYKPFNSRPIEKQSQFPWKLIAAALIIAIILKMFAF